MNVFGGRVAKQRVFMWSFNIVSLSIGECARVLGCCLGVCV